MTRPWRPLCLLVLLVPPACHSGHEKSAPASGPAELVFRRAAVYTVDAARSWATAYANHMERETGSIEVGKLADLIVLDRNLFEVPADEIHTVQVLRTVPEGKDGIRCSGVRLTNEDP